MRSFDIQVLYIIWLLLGCGILDASAQQKGCVDPRAVNYDSGATVNDGSCQYFKTSYKPEDLYTLPEMIDESSGLIYFRGHLWTHNDRGGLAEIYAIDTATSKIVQTVRLKNASNIDWEDMAQDSGYIYIGDFGNNLGTRKDLKIYRIEKNGIPETSDTILNAEMISFYYPDQTDFYPGNQKHDFDCEAFICYQDSLYLFTKNWKSQNTRMYRLPAISGNYEAVLLDSFEVDGLITGADLSNNSELALIGYKNYKPFIWLMFDFRPPCFFCGNKRRIDLNQLFGCQAEGVVYTGNYHILFSSEKTSLVANRVFRLKTSSWTGPTTIGAKDENQE